MANILIIEGDAAVRGLLEAVLQSEGHEVCSAATTSAGYSVLRQAPIEMVIADCDMPEDDALKIVSVVTHDFPAMKGIIVLGDADECRPIQAGFLHDAVEIVPKPIELSCLRGAVHHVLARQWMKEVGQFAFAIAPLKPTGPAFLLLGERLARWSLHLIFIDDQLSHEPTHMIGLLVVDDHALMPQTLQSMLDAQPDLKVVGEAGNGREAISLFQKIRPDVVLMDLYMPLMDGMESTRHIHALSSETEGAMTPAFDISAKRIDRTSLDE